MRIAFVGKKAAGKTFAARYLTTKYKFKHLSLKDPLYDILKKLYYYGGWKRIPWEQEIKFYDALYKLDPNIWVGYLERRLRTTTMNVVVDDPRYINEVQALKELGFILIRIDAPENQRRKMIPAHLQNAAAGSVGLAEYFHKDISKAYQTDYSVLNTDRDSTRRALDIILQKEHLF